MDKSQHTAAYRRLTAALRRAREAAGLTQADVAAKLGAYASFVSKVESGERRVDVVELAALCRAYGTDLVALLRAAEIS
ncbi:xre family transcriptional regulator : XRE family transcriptional regulator OS=Pseudomonas syringae CC1557 GN=N018_03520 PE=4 SV=1: HTH_31 [Gemmataceae bacterium]|nr:xre family transcriptional regulator : XRE family transcriptional regulator OS=Pseudomonas syringae CC1557 GN=N018_03520 PE=4 SV=1: HTH_31 [Gemmataceae bacterium]VTU00883.1 xre family transcriptional regulator : XRE family transcriptional regulator OS=Pseudomonas syringae CC1557 GN=N018_03520 PE=4 SV=1: HTH_31 [Gemmataceae bacterium]